MKVAGLELDLVNLRSEKYADQTSRIPTIEFGTPEEDALRSVKSSHLHLRCKRLQSMIAPCRLLHVSPFTLELPCMSLWSTSLHSGTFSHRLMPGLFCIPIKWGKSKQAAE